MPLPYSYTNTRLLVLYLTGTILYNYEYGIYTDIRVYRIIIRYQVPGICLIIFLAIQYSQSNTKQTAG